MNQDVFIVPQKAVIMEGDKYLILKRSPDAHSYPNCWDFPGGRLEKGEDVLAGLEREVIEETGLRVKATRPVFVFHEILNGRSLVFIVYLCEKISGKINLSHEHTEYKWAKRNDILKLDTENYLRAFLKQDTIM